MKAQDNICNLDQGTKYLNSCQLLAEQTLKEYRN